MSSVALMRLGTAPRMVRASVTRIAARALSSFSIASRILKEVAGRNRWRNPRAPVEVLDFAAGVSAVCVVMVDLLLGRPRPHKTSIGDWHSRATARLHYRMRLRTGARQPRAVVRRVSNARMRWPSLVLSLRDLLASHRNPHGQPKGPHPQPTQTDCGVRDVEGYLRKIP